MGEGNGFVPLVPLEELPDDLRAQWEVTPRAGLQDFLRLMANAPDFFRGFSDLNGKIRANNHLGPRTTELVRLAVAQTTRCKVCLAGRSPAAIEAGMTLILDRDDTEALAKQLRVTLTATDGS